MAEIPILFIPLLPVAGFYLTCLFTKKSLPSYIAFVVLRSLKVMWFMLHKFWDLNIWFIGLSLKSFYKPIVADVVLAMVVQDLNFLPKLHFWNGVGLINHTLLLCYMENQFLSYPSMYYYEVDADVKYPSYKVILTTLISFALVRRLYVDH